MSAATRLASSGSALRSSLRPSTRNGLMAVAAARTRVSRCSGWDRVGLATFWPFDGIEFEGVDNKDACVFPVAIPNPSRRPELAILHRPIFPGTHPDDLARHPPSREVDLDRESIWISYSPMGREGDEPYRLGKFTSHHRLAAPVAPWERLKIGGGTPPVLTRRASVPSSSAATILAR